MESLFYRSNPWWEEEYRYDGIDRELYLEQLMAHFANRDIVFLTGLRRVGKTSILRSFVARLIHDRQIEPQKIFYISLDLIAIAQMSFDEIVTVYRQMHKLSSIEKVYLFFDEVTARTDYQLALKNFYDTENVKIYASSSSASWLRDKNAYLTGRQRVIEVMPLRFDEYLQFKKIHISKADGYLVESYFEQYMNDGGMPEYVLTGDMSYLQNLIDNILYKDIIAYHHIRNETIVKDFYKLLMERSGKQLSLNKMAKILDIGVDTARRYLGYFEDTYLIYTVTKYGKLNERIKNPKKIYAGDVGLKNVVTGFRDKGAIFENLLFLLLKPCRPSYVYEEGIEIDFITENGTLIEAKYHSDLNAKQQKLFEAFPAKQKIIVNGSRDFLQLYEKDFC